MIRKIHIVAMITVISFGLTGIAQARDHDRADRGSRDRASAQVAKSARDRGNTGDRSDAGRAYVRRDGSAGRFVSRVDRRQDNQQSRIREGRQSGSLTKREARQLNKNRKKIDRMERRYAKDGRIDKHERRKLTKALERSSRRIYKLKHNDVYRGSRDLTYSRGHGAGGNWNSRYRSHEPDYQTGSGYQPAVTYSDTVDLLFDGISLSWNTTRQF